MVNITLEELEVIHTIVREFKNNLPFPQCKAAAREEEELVVIIEKFLTIREQAWKGDVVVTVGCERPTAERITR